MVKELSYNGFHGRPNEMHSVILGGTVVGKSSRQIKRIDGPVSSYLAQESCSREESDL